MRNAFFQNAGYIAFPSQYNCMTKQIVHCQAYVLIGSAQGKSSFDMKAKIDVAIQEIAPGVGQETGFKHGL